MIYLKSIGTPQPMYVPKNRRPQGALIFTLKNTINQSMVIEQKVYDQWTYGLYYKIMVTLPADIPSGECEYSLKDDKGVISTGLLIVGDVVETKEYKKVIQYEQY